MLLWTALISVNIIPYGNNPFLIPNIPTPYKILMFLPLYLCIPLIGWLADAKLGNYKLFKAGSVLLFLAMIIGEICSIIVIQYIQYNYHVLDTVIIIQSVTVGLMGMVGTVTCLITALQLGLDQMPDASADNITSFIAWFVCSICFGGWVSSTLLYAIPVCIHQKNYRLDTFEETVLGLLSPVCMTVVCCSLFILAPKHLVVEPKSPQALKTIYQVLKFAAKHKAPLNRSAFTYWEENIPSRLDLGKSKYGGPFTTEQVEDVKTFFKIITIFIPIFINSTALLTELFVKLHWPSFQLGNYCSSQLLNSFAWLIIIIITAIYEIGINPFIKHRVPSTLKRIGIASFIILLIKSFHLVEVVVDFYSPQITNSNEVFLTIHQIEEWANVALGFLYCVTILLVVNGLLEFVCAQSPYNMRGLLTGFVSFIMCSSFLLSGLLTRIIENVAQNYHIIQMVVTTVFGLIGFILHCILARWYKRRVRDEDYSPHRVVEEVYDRYLSQAHTVGAH